jgi:hypothetical protein
VDARIVTIQRSNHAAFAAGNIVARFELSTAQAISRADSRWPMAGSTSRLSN